MRKFVVATFILLFGLFFAPNNLNVLADTGTENDIQIETIYTDGILDYKNLDGISLVAVNENYIAYSNSSTTVTLFNKDSKTYTSIDNFETILSINFVGNKLLVSDTNGIYVLDALSPDSRSPLDINFTSNIKAVDVYVDSNLVYIGYIDNNTFILNEYTLELQPKENPIKSVTNNKLGDTIDLAINNKNAYIICESSITTLYKLGYQENTLTEKINNRPFTKIDTFYSENQEYVVIFGLENLFLYKGSSLSNEQSPICQRSDDPISKEQLRISNFDCYNGTIYVSDRQSNGKIQEYHIEQEVKNDNITYTLTSNSILICSKNKDKGRFNGASGITVSGSNIIVTDKGNDSVHLIDSTTNTTNYIEATKTNDEKLFTNPSAPVLDEDLNLYFVSTNDENNSSIIKYYPTISNNGGEVEYKLTKSYSTISSRKLGTISSISSYKNVVYAIDCTNNKLLLVTQNGILEKSDLPFEASVNSKIICLKSSSNIIIYNNQTLYLLDSTGLLIDSLSTAEELKSITCDYSHTYGLGENKIYIYSINLSQEATSNLTEIDRVESNTLKSLNCIHFDIATRIMFGFDNVRECLVKFDFTKITNPFENLTNITDTTPLSSDPLAINLKSTRTTTWSTEKTTPVIFKYPNQIGTAYNIDGSITACIGIEETETEYRVLFKNNGILTTGYVNKQNVDKLNITPSHTNVITINKKVPIYKYPTLLRYNGGIIKVGELDHKTVIDVSGKFPTSIDGKTFYKYEFDGKVGYIFNADIVKNDNKVIGTVQANNATVKAIGVEKISVFKTDSDEDSEVILELKNGDRVYVKEYSKDSKYTKIVYTDKNQNSTEGYILTEYLETDKLDDTKIVLIIVICVSVVLLGVVVASYIAIKKKRK